MNRTSAVIVAGLLTIAAVEFGLLGASAAGLTGSDRDLPPVAQRGVIQNTPTPTFGPPADATVTPTPTPGISPPNVSPPMPDLTGVFIQADPLTIRCNGSDTTWITARLFQSNGQPAPDGTWAYFYVANGTAQPWSVQTSGGYATTQVRLYSDGYYPGPNVIVSSGLLEAGIRVLCLPESDNGCPASPPSAVSPPCPTPIPTETSQPSPPECHLSPPAISPPCETPTPFVSPPDNPLRLAIDCAPAEEGVQDNCDVAAGVGQTTVDVVLINDGDVDVRIAAFNFWLVADAGGRLEPVELADGNLDDNPDFNQDGLGDGWSCTPPEPRGDDGSGGPGQTVSFLSCFNASGGDFGLVQSAGFVSLASVSYDVQLGSPVSVPWSLTGVNVFDLSGYEIASCAPPDYVPAECAGATLALNGTQPAATSTATPPSAEPTPARRTPTLSARTASPVATQAPVLRRRCADVTGDGIVTLRDVRRIAEQGARRSTDARYDINGDGQVTARDAIAAARQLGRRC